METLLARVGFEGRSCVTSALGFWTPCSMQSVKGVFFKLAGPLKDPGASKAGYFLLAFLACWPWQDQLCSLAQKAPHGLKTQAEPKLSHPSFLLSLFECGTRRDSTSCQEPPAAPSSAFREGQSLRQSNMNTSVLSLCLRLKTQSAITTNICVEPRYGPRFLWNCCWSTCFFKSEPFLKIGLVF